MHISTLVAEIGSTTTIVNAFDITGKYAESNSGKNALGNGRESHSKGLPGAVFIGQGMAPTSVAKGDVRIGLKEALENLKNNLCASTLEWDEMLATSSAAGGLRMSVHGLVYDMTVRAAREAALGAGAIIKMVTAGRLRKSDLNNIIELRPNIILIAGGVDYGERETALYNFEAVASLKLNIPVIYAGNIQNYSEITEIAEEFGVKVHIVENVYPKVDALNVEPARKIIQDVFEENITRAPGMGQVREMVNGHIIPTPGAVMEAAKLLKEYIGGLVVFDVGGATTDVHSVTEDSEEVSLMMTKPEPLAKRTVEGDLGIFVNIKNVASRIGAEELNREFNDAEQIMESFPQVPASALQKDFAGRLTREAVCAALERHAGKMSCVYGPMGKKMIADGKDLTNVKYIIGTGGALTRLPAGREILESICAMRKNGELYPKKDATVLIDSHYIMASLGVLSKQHPEAALQLMKSSLGI